MKGRVGGGQDRSPSGHPRSLPEGRGRETQPAEVDGERVAGGLANTALNAHLGRAAARVGRRVRSQPGVQRRKPASRRPKLHGGLPARRGSTV